MTKKLLLFIMSALMAVTVSGCAMLDLGKVTTTEDAATESEKAVAKFHEDIRSYSLGEFEDYFVPDDDALLLYERLTDTTALKNSFNKVFMNIYDNLTEEKAEEVLLAYTARIYGAGDYTIDRTVVDGDETDVWVTMTMPDPDRLKTADEVDISAVLEEKFEFDINDPDLFFSELALRKGKSESELREFYSDSDASVWISDILELFSDEFNSCFGYIMDEILAECPVNEYKFQYTVEKQADDTWKITDVDND